MLFKRRTSETLPARLRVMLWPRRSLSRSVKYFSKRVLRLRASPHAVAAGVAAGVFSSFFPIGFHFVIAGAVAWLIAGNFVAAAIGTALGNPLTFPLLWGASYETGKLILHEPAHGPGANLGEMMHNLKFSQIWEPILKPITVGAIPLGLVSGVVVYAITRWGMITFRENRRRRVDGRRSGPAAVQ